jgi:hypothetical protein
MIVNRRTARVRDTDKIRARGSRSCWEKRRIRGPESYRARDTCPDKTYPFSFLAELSRFDNSQNVKMSADLLVERVARLAKATRQEWSRFAVAFRGARRYRDIKNPSFSGCPA